MLIAKCLECGVRPQITGNLCGTCKLVKKLHDASKKARPVPLGTVNRPQAKAEPPLGQQVIDEPATPAPQGYSSAVAAGVHHGLSLGTDAILLSAAKFAATLGSVPRNTSVAQAFFNYNQKHFYNHMRTLLKALDGKKKLPGKKRLNQVRNIPPGAHSDSNKRLALALRFLRIYMQVEQKPMALMIGRSQAAIWHIEAANHNIVPLVVAAYADAFNIGADSIYRYANALGRGPAKHHDAADMVTKFVDCVLRGR